MFDKGLLETDAFMDMPMPTKALYFLLGMEADDEGFVSPTRVMRIYGGNADDLKVLIAKKFVIQFESGVIVITDWKKNNWLDSRRVKKTIYEAEKALLSESNDKYVLLSGGLASTEENRVEQKSIEKNSISEQSSQEISRFIKLFETVNPSYEKFYGNKTQRAAASRLLKKYGFEKSAGMVKYLPIINADKYAKGKSITPLQLEDNLGLIVAHYNQQKNKKPKIAIIS